MRRISVPRYDSFTPASAGASSAARGSSRKTDTKPEVLLRKALWRAGLRYRKYVADLPGNPDVVFKGARVVVFCDGDFWHGKNWGKRRKKLLRGTNPTYWLAKIERNMERDREINLRLKKDGWTVLRFWESEILDALERVVGSAIDAVRPNDTKGKKLPPRGNLVSRGT